jgi:hypothetical protein
MRQMNRFLRNLRNALSCKALHGICDIQSVISVLFDLRLHAGDVVGYGLLLFDPVTSETTRRIGGA